jgi:DNA end-binding protein Ku
MHALANVPTRATNTITLSFGLLNIELAAYTGTESTRVSRKEFFNGDANVPLGRAVVRKDNGETVDTTDVTRMAQAENGAWVVLTDDEVAACTMEKGVAEIESFVPLLDVGLYSAENVMQVRPKSVKGKVNSASGKAYALLLTAMAEREVAALVRVAMRGPARPALLTPSGDLLLVRTADAVRKPLPLPEHDFTEAEVNLAKTLIDTVGVDSPVVVDETAPKVAALVEAKAEGVEMPERPVAVATPVDNLLAALQASIDAAAA